MNSDDAPAALKESHPKRQAIVQCARAAFMNEGYAATKIEPIARRAGVSTATLYSLFEGKAELFAAVIDDASDEFARQFERIGQINGDARQQLVGFAMAYGSFMADPFVRSVFRLVTAERPRFQPVAMRFFEKGRHDIGAALMSILTRLSAAGALKTIAHPSWATGQLMGMVEHPVFLVPLVTGDEVKVRRTIAEVAEDAVDTFLARYGV